MESTHHQIPSVLRAGAFRVQNLEICFKRLFAQAFLAQAFLAQVKLFYDTLKTKKAKKEFQRSIAKSLKEVEMCEKHKDI